MHSNSNNVNNNKPKLGFKLNLDVVKQQKKQEELCFQDEFMAKLDEYSESWREAAIKEQRH